jgi:asparagine synthase (glutamine-hydrolysing)
LPVTRIFPGVAQSNESEWQELVIRHLKLGDWIREKIVDEMDVVGPLAQARLRAHGVLWSPLLHGDEFFLRHAGGGSVLDGEGGDDVCDPRPHRVAPLARMIRHRRPPNRRRLRLAASVLAPGLVRGIRAASRGLPAPQPWLREAARELLQERWGRHVAQEPLDARRSIMLVLARHAVSDLQQNRRFFAGQRDTNFVSPLLEPSVVEAIANVAGYLGFRDRSAGLGAFCGDLLPPQLLERRTKAEFNATFFNVHTREFAEKWTGAGVDPTLVDAQVLREVWQGSEGNALSACLLQSAWLAAERRRVDWTPVLG